MNVPCLIRSKKAALLGVLVREGRPSRDNGQWSRDNCNLHNNILYVLPLPPPPPPTPIANLCELSKIFERVVHRQIIEYITINNILDCRQSGFRGDYSTQSALLRVCHDVRHAVDIGQVTILVLFDFSKAFDTVSHSKLLFKLRGFGFSDIVLTCQTWTTALTWPLSTLGLLLGTLLTTVSSLTSLNPRPSYWAAGPLSVGLIILSCLVFLLVVSLYRLSARLVTSES